MEQNFKIRKQIKKANLQLILTCLNFNFNQCSAFVDYNYKDFYRPLDIPYKFTKNVEIMKWEVLKKP